MDSTHAQHKRDSKVELASYYEILAAWLDLRAQLAQAEQVYKAARVTLERFDAQHFPQLHHQRESLIRDGAKLTPLGRLRIEPQDPARLRRGAEYYRGLVDELNKPDSTEDSKVSTPQST